MRKEATRLVPVALLTLSIGFTIPAHAEGNNNSQPLSDNCRESSQTSGSPVISMPRILCQEAYSNAEVFGNLQELANGITGGTLQDPAKPEPPKQQRTTPKPHGAPPRRQAKAKRQDTHKWGGTGFASFDREHSKGLKGRRTTPRKSQGRFAKTASIRDTYFIGRKLSGLSRARRMELRSKYESLLTRKDVNNFLDWIQRHEGGGLVTVVGGIRGKSPRCQKRIKALSTSAHPKDQGLPNKCFLTTRKYGLSTACGKYQIVHTNWKSISRLLALEDFSAQSQKIAALELVRSSKAVSGGRVGDGLVALVRGDMASAIRLGTDPWAGSPHSRWHSGGSGRVRQEARRGMKRSGKGKYVRQQADNLLRGHAS